MRRNRARRRNDSAAVPLGAFALTLAMAAACGGKSVVVSDDAGAGEPGSGGQGGSSAKGGKGGKGGGSARGGTGGDAGSVGATGGTAIPTAGGSGGSGGSGAQGGSTGGSGAAGGAGGAGGSFGGRGGRSSGGRGGSAGFGGVGAAGRGAGGFATGGFAGFAGSGMAGFAGAVSCDSCDDEDVCTDDVCEVSGMCTHPFNTAPCDDGDACTATEHCVSGLCLPGEPVSCDDLEDCTLDSCNSDTGCNHVPAGIAEDPVDRAIPDSQIDCGPPEKSAVSTVGLVDSGTVVWVEAEIQLTHTWAGDLTINLEHNGMVVTLYDRFPGDGSLSSDFGGTYVFAATGELFSKLGNDVTIPSDTYASFGSLDAFKGMDAAGDWQLTISDSCHDDKGSMQGFTLRVGSSCTGADSCPGACDTQGSCICAP